MLADTSEFPWRNLPAGLRTKPLGPPFGAS
jgi:hypothetical protein